MSTEKELQDTAVKLPVLQQFYHKGQIFRHVDGGFYQFDRLVFSSQDQSTKVIYDHVWPFDPSGWERPLHEWQKNFKPSTQEALKESMQRDQVEVRKEITEHRTNRRLQEKKNKI